MVCMRTRMRTRMCTSMLRMHVVHMCMHVHVDTVALCFACAWYERRCLACTCAHICICTYCICYVHMCLHMHTRLHVRLRVVCMEIT